MRRDDDAFWTLREQIAERNAGGQTINGAKLDVNPLRAVIQRRGQDQAALLFASVEVPTLPHRAAGHDRGHTPALECAAHVEVGHAVETQLHHVAAHRSVAGSKEFGHRSAGDGLAQRRHGQKKSPVSSS
jgi:hypothetical protein